MTRILTTHVGSLPRSQAVADLLFARERGEAHDQATFDAAMAAACAVTVRRQVEAGIGIVSDGETSKISYATYVKDRYTGFEGDSPRNAPADLRLFPGFLERLARSGGTPQYARPCCTGPVMPEDDRDLKADIGRLKAAMAEHGAARGFMNAASPGVVSLFLPTGTNRRARPTSPPSRTRCGPSTRRSSRPASTCSSTAPTSPSRATCSSRTSTTTSS
jgi:5-methyltetrahydropteroyltriglutamate--homocysteine methyltransferase